MRTMAQGLVNKMIKENRKSRNKKLDFNKEEGITSQWEKEQGYLINHWLSMSKRKNPPYPKQSPGILHRGLSMKRKTLNFIRKHKI